MKFYNYKNNIIIMHSIAGDFILQQDNPSCQRFFYNFFIIFYDRIDFTAFGANK